MSLDLNKSYDNEGDEEDVIEFSSGAASFNSNSANESQDRVYDSTQMESSEDEYENEDDDANETDVHEDDDDIEADVHNDETNNLNGSMGSGEESPIVDENNSIEVLKSDVERLIDVGSVIESLDEALDLYSEYAGLVGFSVKKGTQFYFKNTSIEKIKVYHCSCEGFPDNRSSLGRLASYKKQTYRTNCKARLRVLRKGVDAPWKVTVFYKDHNHELVNPSASYLLRSSRNLSRSKKTLLLAMIHSGIGVSRAYQFLENEAGGRENVGFIPKDAYNQLYHDRRTLSKVDNGDANKLVEYLTQKGLSDPSFYWKVHLSDDRRMKNLFFRDGRCLIDYQHFGDVISVDATYKTKKYDLICVPIIGINHHRTNVMFGMAFLSDEKTESYEWLFRTFLESMYQKEPSIIFSDQDQALMNGLDLTFREASHRLCQWHVNKNAVKHFGRLNQNKHFKSLWHRCMNGCESEDQFECAWRSMIEEHRLADNKWFCNMYTLRKRWSSAFTRDKFSGGLHATSRSEVTNKVLKDLCSTTSTIHEFVMGFERMQKDWRRREFEEDALCRGMPGMFVQRTGILVQVAQLCTQNVFKLFEFQAVNSIAVILKQEPPDMNVEMLEFKVSSTSSVTGYRLVKFNQLSQFATCSCRMWETEGVLCRHLFKVYFHLNFLTVPEVMILNRWRKDSKERIPSNSEHSSLTSGVNNLTNMVFVNHNAKLLYDILTECKDDKICRDRINKHIRHMLADLKSLKKGTNQHIEMPETDGVENLHGPLRNPRNKKKRPAQRHNIRKHWEDDQSQSEMRSSQRMRQRESPFTGSEWPTDEQQSGWNYCESLD